jgi:glycerophosphoryl diester phosphodiesterase
MRYGFAHRGGSHGPDNALATFTDALARGATGLETDAWLSLDGHVVLDHDGFADRRTREPIANVRRDQLPAHMATLDELYECCGTDFVLAVDVKTAAVATALVETAERYDATAKLWIVAPAAATLRDLATARRAVTIRGNVLRSLHRAAALAEAKEHGADAVNARWMWWTAAIVEEVHQLGMLGFGYDAQRRASLDRSVRIGLDGVFSDHVDRMTEALARAGSP